MGTQQRIRVVAYLRVSTDKQAEEGNGLDVQEQAIRAWARANGYRIVGWFRAEGVSGSNGLDTRVGLYDALTEITAGHAQGIVVKCLDRLARDLVLQESLLAEIKRMGAQPFTTSAGEQAYLTDDPDDPSRKLIRQILGAVNEYERSMITLRLRTGRASKASKGGYAYGSPAYGQRADDRELVPDEAEQAGARRIQELRASGASMRGIADTLNAAGIPAKRGGTWSPMTVKRVLDREQA